MTTRKSSTAKKRTSKSSTPAPKPMYGTEFYARLSLAEFHVRMGTKPNGFCPPSCKGFLIPEDIITAEHAHRAAVSSALRDIGRAGRRAGKEGIQIELCDAPAGLPLKIARDVLYILRAAAV